MAEPTNPVAKLLEKLALEELDRDLFLGNPGKGEGRLFGGLVAAQSAVAVGRTVVDGTLHSLHAYFLRPGQYDRPIRFVVDRIRDGRTFTTRRVVALQDGEAIFNLSASFSRSQAGIEHQEKMPEAPDPAGLEEWGTLRASFFNAAHSKEVSQGPIEIRLRNDYQTSEGEDFDPVRRVWMRLNGPAPADPLLRIAIAVYASDRTLMGSAMRPVGLHPGPDVTITSLDHALWLHEVPSLEGWWLYTAQSPLARSGRAIANGAMWDEQGTRFATVTQEGLVRRSEDRPIDRRT